MARRKTREEFIKEATDIHGCKYDYSLVEYINNRIKVRIICPIHGEFQISPAGHVPMKYGCINCGGTRKRTTDEFIENAAKFHNNRYGYSKVIYHNTETEIIIDCPIHGEIKQTPFDHMHSYGCNKCGIRQRNITKVNQGQLPPTILDRSEYEIYFKQVRQETNRNYKKYKDKINPDNLKRSFRGNNHLDHIYSVIQGFHNNVPPNIIGHWTNLRIIPCVDNLKKNGKCAKTLEQVFEDFIKFGN